MSYYTMAFFGAALFGSLLTGMLAHRIGAPHTVVLTGAFCAAGALWFTLNLPKIRALCRAQATDPSPGKLAASWI
jgi:fucose permease